MSYAQTQTSLRTEAASRPRRRRQAATRPRKRLKLIKPKNLYELAVALMFGVVMLLSVAFMAWDIAGVPVRAVVAGLLLVALAVFNRREMMVSVQRHWGLLLLTAMVAVIGVFSSVLAKNDLVLVAKQLIEIHVQTVVNLLLAAVVTEICGATTVFVMLIGAIGLSAAFAVLQFVGVGPAWAVRDAIAHMSGESDHLNSAAETNYDRTRPPGLSLSKITLATQMCLALAAIFIRQQRIHRALNSMRQNDVLIGVAVAVFCVGCMASGNRSPILGGLAFYACYLVRNRPGLLLLMAPAAIIAIPAGDLLLETLQSTGLRAFSTGDKSSEGRQTLIYYGWRLLCARPIGYGLAFDPRLHWQGQWQYIQSMPNAIVVRAVELHNYVLNMLNYYGVLILAVLPLAFKMMWNRRAYLLGFIPYVTHIIFHNYGPYQNDSLIVVLIAAAVGPFAYKRRRRSTRRASRDAGSVAGRSEAAVAGAPEPVSP